MTQASPVSTFRQQLCNDMISRELGLIKSIINVNWFQNNIQKDNFQTATPFCWKYEAEMTILPYEGYMKPIQQYSHMGIVFSHIQCYCWSWLHSKVLALHQCTILENQWHKIGINMHHLRCSCKMLKNQHCQ